MKSASLRLSNIRSALYIVFASVPVAIYLWFIKSHAVNAPFWDDWLQITSLRELHEGTLNWGFIYGGDNAQRSLLPRLFGLAAASLSHFNVTVVIYASAACLIAAYSIMVSMLRRYAVPWAFIAPAGFLLFGLARYEDALWASDFAWDFVLMLVVSAIALLDSCSMLAFVGAVVLAACASLSSLQGLFIWPAGILCLALARADKTRIIIWLCVALATGAAYFHNLNTNYSDPLHNATHTGGFSLSHAGQSFSFALASLGNSYLVVTPNHKGPVWLLLVLGGVLGLIGLAALIIAIRRSPEDRLSAFLAALVLFNLFFIASITYGRSWSGIAGAVASRYTIYSLLMASSAYVIFYRWAFAVRTATIRKICFASMVLFFTSQIVVSSVFAFQIGTTIWHERNFAGMVAQNYGTASDELLQRGVYWSADTIRYDFGPYASARGLAVFSGGNSFLDDFWCQGSQKDVDANVDLPKNGTQLSEHSWNLIRSLYLRAGAPSSIGAPKNLSELSWAIGAMSQGRNFALCFYPYGVGIRSEYLLLSNLWLPAGEALRRIGHDSAPMRVISGLTYRVTLHAPLNHVSPCALLGFDKYKSRCVAEHRTAFTFKAPVQVFSISLRYTGRYTISEISLPSAQNHIRGSRALKVGWLELSRAYELDPNLQIQIPEALPNFTYDLASWATRSIARSDKEVAGIAAYVAAYARIRSLASSAGPKSVSGFAVLQTRDRPGWYLPDGFTFAPSNDPALLFWGKGFSQPLYAHSSPISVKPRAWTQILATIDARNATKGSACIYLAALPSGLALGMSCVPAGRKGHLKTQILIPAGVREAAFVAFTNTALLPKRALLLFSEAAVAHTR